MKIFKKLRELNITTGIIPKLVFTTFCTLSIAGVIVQPVSYAIANAVCCCCLSVIPIFVIIATVTLIRKKPLPPVSPATADDYDWIKLSLLIYWALGSRFPVLAPPWMLPIVIAVYVAGLFILFRHPRNNQIELNA